MTIRKMTIADYDAVYALWRNTPGMGLNSTDDSREGIGRHLERNPDICFVAEDEAGAVAGMILSGHDGRRGYIHHMAVALSQRGKGMGSELLERAMMALEGEGIHKVALVVFGENEQGNAFWERRGFFRRDDLVYRNKNIHTMERIEP